MARTPRRTYSSDLRTAQAEGTRKAILVAAGKVCRAGGWAQATVAAIAAEAGVSKESVYAIFGNKVTLIGEMVKASVAEEVHGQHFLEQERPASIMAEAGVERQIELWADYLADIMERLSPLMAVVQAGAQVEPGMQDLYRGLHEGRRRNLSVIAGSLVGRSGLREGLSTDDVTEKLWQLASPELHRLLVNIGGYSTQDYCSWLAGTLKNAFLK